MNLQDEQYLKKAADRMQDVVRRGAGGAMAGREELGKGMEAEAAGQGGQSESCCMGVGVEPLKLA